MFYPKKKSVVGIGIMLVLTAFISMQTNVSADENRPPVAEAGGPYVFDECIEILFDASSSYDPDPGTFLQYRWNFNGSWTEWSYSPYQSYMWRDDFSGIITLEVTDGDLNDSDVASVTILNHPPEIKNITGPVDPVDVGVDVDINVSFFDGDGRTFSLDTFHAIFIWGDGNTTEYDIFDGWVDIAWIIGTHPYEEPGEYEILILLTDDNGGSAQGDYFVTIVLDGELSTVEAGPDATINEGDLFISSGTTSAFGPGYTAIVEYGDGSAPEPLPLSLENTFDLSHQYCDNGIYTVLVTVFEDDGFEWVEWGLDTATVTVLNVAPIITLLSGSLTDPIPIDSSIQLNGQFTDPGSLDTHVAEIDWDDNQTTSIDIPMGTYEINADHFYDTPGVYTITLTITDDDGGSDSQSLEYYIVVYDPDSGFVTGGGWILSPEGAYPADPLLTGKATFGFVSKYKKGKSVPEGNTEFQLHMAGLNFHSHTYDWLVIAGPKAMYKGIGTINGEGNYGFLLSAIDGQIQGGGGVDKFRIKIWDKDQGDLIVYDNNIGAPEDGDPTTVLGGGQITIHKK